MKPTFIAPCQVVGSISELYTFMDSADATLARKVLGEVDGEEGEGAEGASAAVGAAEAGGSCQPLCCLLACSFPCLWFHKPCVFNDLSMSHHWVNAVPCIDVDHNYSC